MSDQNRFRQQTLSRAQNAVLNPVFTSSERATVLSVAEQGLYRNSRGIFTCTLYVETQENPGHPVQLTGLASIAKLMGELKEGDVISFNGTIHGSLGRGRSPYVVPDEVSLVRDPSQE